MPLGALTCCWVQLAEVWGGENIYTGCTILIQAYKNDENEQQLVNLQNN